MMKFIVTAHGLNITKAQILSIQFYWFSTPRDENRAVAGGDANRAVAVVLILCP